MKRTDLCKRMRKNTDGICINNASGMRATVLREGVQLTEKPAGGIVKERAPRSREREKQSKES